MDNLTDVESVSSDVLLPVLERLGDFRGGRTQVCYVHAPPGLGASHLVRTWLTQRNLWSRVVWLSDAEIRASVDHPPRSILVLEGLTAGPDSEEIAARVRRHDHVIVIGTGALNAWRAVNAEIYPAKAVRLTAAEIAAVVKGRRLELTPGAMGELESATAGWPVLVDLVLGAYAPGERVRGVELGLAEARPQVATRVLRFLSPEQQKLVRVLAVTGGLTAEELEALGAIGVAGDLRRMGLVTKDRTERHLIHQLLGLVGTAIAAELEEPAAASILMRLAEQREKLGVLDYGLGFALAAEAWALVSRIIDHWGTELSFSPHARLLQQAIWEVPHSHLTAYPGTWHRAEYAGILPLGRAPVRIPDPANYASLLDRGAAPLLLKRTVMAVVARRVHQNYADALEIVRGVRPLAQRTVRQRHAKVASATAYWFLQAGVTLELAGAAEEAISHYRLGWQAARHDLTGVSAIDLAGKLAALTAWHGDNAEAEDWLAKEPAELDQDAWYTPHVLSGYQQAAAVVASDRLDRAEGERRVVELRRPTTADEYWVWRLAAQVHHLLTWGESQRAHDEVRAAARDNPHGLNGDGAYRQLMQWLEAETALAAGHGNRARQLIASIEHPPTAATLSARLALLSGDLEQALSVTSLALRRSSSRRQTTQLLLIQAIAADQLGDRSLGEQALSRATAQIQVTNDLRALCTVPRAALAALATDSPPLRALLARVEEAGGVQIHPDRVELVELTDRETAVLEQLVRGRSLREAADELYVSVNTVKSQARALYRSLGVSSRPALVEMALRLGLVEATD